MENMENVVNDIELFNFKNTDVRVVKREEDEPWFVAKDVCDALELSNSRMAVDGLEEDEKDVSTLYTPGGMQSLTILSLPGLFRLVSKSRVPMAREFQRWVYHEVLPAIYHTGRYESPESGEGFGIGCDAGRDFKTAKYLIDGVTAFRDVMSPLMRKRIMKRYYELIGMPQPSLAGEVADDGKYVSFSMNGRLERFVDECCCEDPYSRCSTREFYQAFDRWCAAHGYPTPSINIVSRAVSDLGLFRKVKTSKDRMWAGVHVEY